IGAGAGRMGKGSGGPARGNDSSGQTERTVEPIGAQRDLLPRRCVDRGVRDRAQRAELGRGQADGADGGTPGAKDEVVGSDERERESRLLQAEEVLDGLRERSV